MNTNIASSQNNLAYLQKYKKSNNRPNQIQSDKFILNLERNFLSPKRSERTHNENHLLLSPRNNKNTQLKNTQGKKYDNDLFTIEENYYTRKNQNLLTQRPPKFIQFGQKNTVMP